MARKKKAISSIVLAAGKSSRMRDPGKAKVCYPVAGKPAIVLILEALRQVGVRQHVVVVGTHAEQVMQTIAEGFGEVAYAFQTKALGTGNAAKYGAALLQRLSFTGNVLVTVGDRLTRPEVLQRLIDRFEQTHADLAFIVGEKQWEPDAGRVVFNRDGSPLASIEKYDTGRSRLLAVYFAQTENGAIIDANRAITLAKEFIGPERKIATALGDLYGLLRRGIPISREQLLRHFSPDDRMLVLPKRRKITGAEVEKSQFVNLSVFLFKAEVLYAALEQIGADNAQQEEYLPDVIAILAEQGKHLLAVNTEGPEESLAFNTPDDLQRVEQALALQVQPIRPFDHKREMLQPLGKWLQQIELPERIRAWRPQPPDAGRETAPKTQPSELLQTCLEKFRTTYGDGAMLVARAPARVNLMGRHIDHQGGPCNTIGIDRSIYVVARPRPDRTIRLRNIDAARYPGREFNLDELRPLLLQHSWDEFLRLPQVHNAVRTHPGDWANYVYGILLHLQKAFPDKPITGMDVVTGGDIPAGSGLGSSSALVVAVAEAVVEMNRLGLAREELAILCAEAEWFAGTRGGAGDHAAMLLATVGHVQQLMFKPLTVQGMVKWPENLSLVLCYSGKPALKTSTVRQIFNQRVACYTFALQFFRKRFPQWAGKVQGLGDLLPEKLAVSLPQFYQLLLDIPETATGQEIARQIDVDWEKLLPGDPSAEANFFPLREVLLFGLAEMQRSYRLQDTLEAGSWDYLGRLIRASHDGDRISKMLNGVRVAHRPRIDNEYLHDLARRAEQGDPSAALEYQPGRYACSTPEIDAMVDLAQSVDGVIGAEILGAGLGGSVAVFAQAGAEDACMEKLHKEYYTRIGFEPIMFVCEPVDGSGVL